VKPWSAVLGARASLLYALLPLALGAVVSCTTVASSADREPSASATVAPGAVAAATAAEAPSPMAEAGTPSLTAGPASPLPSPSVSPAATLATPSATLAASAAPVAEASATAELVAAGPTLDGKTTAKLQRIIDNQVANKRVAGLQVAVRLADGETWLGTAGNAEFDPDRALDDNDQMAIASVTKTFIAALILQLAEEGKVDLDATFGTYFRDAPRKDSVTLRQLLSHTSGIYNFWANPRYGRITKAWWENPGAGGLKARSHEWTYEEMMKLVKSGEFKPGEDYQYSNTNYVILGKVAEAVTGKSLSRLLNARFFKPLGLEDTIYQPAQKPRPDAAHGHWDWGGGYIDHTRDSDYVPFMAAASIADAAGAMASTAKDLSVWAAALYGGEVLSPRMTREMTTFLKPGWYGLGADVAVFAGHRGHGHRGGIRGYESSMWYFTDDGVSIVLLSNQGNWLTDVPMERLVKAVLGQA
jgi:D-alanyl-D-alanine carboxypeptidase